MRYRTFIPLLALWLLASLTEAGADSSHVTLQQAVELALANDPWLEGSEFTQQSLAERAVAAAALPDPKLSLMAESLPVDNIGLHREPMTQLSMGFSQQFPRGHSRELSARQHQELERREPLLRADRRAQVTMQVSGLWLDAFRAGTTIELIERDRSLFEQLGRSAEVAYAAAVGHTGQADVIGAQLELTRLDDRLAVLEQEAAAARQRLAEWLGGRAASMPPPGEPPQIPLDWPELLAVQAADPTAVAARLRRHPALLALDQQIAAAETAVDLERQKYKPEWELAARYGYRDDDPFGQDQSDLFSLGVSFDLPLFPGNRQDREVRAAAASAAALKTEKALLLRQMAAALAVARAELLRLEQRRALYRDRLLPQVREQAAAALLAYDNDAGDFDAALRARIAELDANIDALAIEVEWLKLVAQLNYLAAQSEPATATAQVGPGESYE